MSHVSMSFPAAFHLFFPVLRRRICQRSPGSPIVPSFSRVSCPCSVAAGVRDSLGVVLSQYASMGELGLLLVLVGR